MTNAQEVIARASPLSPDYHLMEKLKENAGKYPGFDWASNGASTGAPSIPTCDLMSCKQLKEDLKENKMLQKKYMDKLHTKLVVNYNKALTQKKYVVAQCIRQDGSLKPLHPPEVIKEFETKKGKMRHGYNGEYVYTKLKICEVELHQLSVMTKLKDRYCDIIDKAEQFEDPYNTEGEKRKYKLAFIESCEEFHRTVQELQAVEHERDVWLADLQKMTLPKHGFMYYFKKIIGSHDHSLENELDQYKRQVKKNQKEELAKAKASKGKPPVAGASANDDSGLDLDKQLKPKPIKNNIALI